MLKAIYKVRPELEFEVEAKEQKDVFRQIANIQEVFSEKVCGLCKKTDLKFVVREVEDNEFYEMRCNSCGGKLAFGQNKKGGTVYPVRKLKNGKPAKTEDTAPFDYESQGWHKYIPTKEATGKPPQSSKR